MDLEQTKKIVEVMKDINSRNNLNDTSKSLLPYMEWLIEQAEKTQKYEKALLEIVETPEDSFHSFEEAYLESVRIAMKVMNYEE